MAAKSAKIPCFDPIKTVLWLPRRPTAFSELSGRAAQKLIEFGQEKSGNFGNKIL